MNLRRLISHKLIAQTRSFPSRVSSREDRSLRPHTTRRGSRAGCALLALMLAQFSWTAGAQAEATHTIIAASGAAAPAGGNYRAFLNVALNARGQVAFDAFLGGPSTSGVFVNDGMTTSVIALGGDPDPAAGNFSFVFAPSITTRGDVIFDTDTGIFRADGRSTVPLMQNGDAAPSGGSLTLSSTHVANSRGDIAYFAIVTGGVSTQGIFRNNGTHTVAIADDNTLAPTGGTFNFFGGSSVINRDGRVAFFAGTTGSADFGIYRGDGETTTTIFAANQSAPGGATFVDFSNPLINKHGQVLALALLENGTGPAGLFLGDGMDAVAIALSGDAAPTGGTYTTFFGPLTLNDRGQSAFEVFLTGGASGRGIFRGDGATTTPIALQGTAAAGTTGTFDSFGDLKMGKDGSVAFIATLTLGVGGVDASNNRGIWVGTSDTDLHLVVRSGQIIGGKTLTRPVSLAPRDMNERPVVWLAGFSGFSTAIVSSDLDGESDAGRGAGR
jgi:hypothetical protein